MRFTTQLIRIVYTLIFYVALPFLVLRLLIRSKKQPGYRKRIKERFGFVTRLSRPSICIHAVSVGESIASIPMIEKIIAAYPEYNIHVTTTTPGGSEQIQKQLGDRVTHSYLPFDVPSFINRFLNRVQAKLFIIMETEIWPNLLYCLRKKQISSLVANARLSEKSFHAYNRLHDTASDFFGLITKIAAQSAIDVKHYKALNVADSNIEITGSIKFDREIPTAITSTATALRQFWQLDKRPVMIAASTRDGEEPYIIEAFKKIKTQHPDAFLILVPRHPERSDGIITSCHEAGFTTQRRSAVDNETKLDCDILIGDTIGELLLFYALSDIAYVGGSLVDTGCHNVLEPAALAKPIITGPSLRNFKAITNLLIHAKGQIVIKTADELANSVCELIENPEKSREIGENALHIYQSNQGATQKHLDIIEKLIRAI